ncbi:MAG: hypothetical protein J5998_09895, partial [Clostridia bacterium]|nr:hypothetical protein [Clostridia bacterium]
EGNLFMALVKCPRCELNYILDGGTLCTVCRREVRGEHEIIDTPEMCSVCGENPAVAGSDLCMFCLKEMNRRMPSSMDDSMVPDANIGIDSVSTMDEIELDIVDDAMASEFGAEDEFKDQEEEGEDGDLLSTEALAEDEDAQDDDDEDDEDE